MAEKISMDFGEKEYEIGDTGIKVKLNLNDSNLPVRFEQAEKNIQDFISKVQKDNGIKEITDINNIGSVSTGDVEKDIGIIKSADKYIKEQIDYIFNSEGLACAVLGELSALTVNSENGNYAYEIVLNAFAPVINKLFNASLKNIKSRLKKYSDYKTAHPALRK